MVNSGLRNGLASAGVMRCMSCQAVISVGPSSLGRMTEIPTGVPPVRLLDASSDCLGNPASREARTANEAHDWAEGFGGHQAGEEEPGHGRLERPCQMRPACDASHLVPQLRDEKFKPAEVDPVTCGGDNVVDRQVLRAPIGCYGQHDLAAVGPRAGHAMAIEDGQHGRQPSPATTRRQEARARGVPA